MGIADALREEPSPGEQDDLILRLGKLVVEVVPPEFPRIRRKAPDGSHPCNGENQRCHGNDDNGGKPAQLGRRRYGNNEQESERAKLDDLPRINLARRRLRLIRRGLRRLIPYERHQKTNGAGDKRTCDSKRKERHPIDSRQLDNQSNRCRRRRPYHAGDEPSAESRSQKLFVVVAAARTGHLIGQRNRRDADKHSDERSHDAYQRVITAVGVCVTDEHLAKRLAVSPMLHRNAQKRHQDEHGDEVRVFP